MSFLKQGSSQMSYHWTEKTFCSSKFSWMAEQVLLAVADPGFPRGRDTNSKGGCEKLLFSHFSLKPP